MRNTDPCHHILMFLPSPEKEGRWKSVQKNKKNKKTFPAAGGRKKIITPRGHRQVILPSPFVQNKHPHVPSFPPPPLLHSSKCPLCSFSRFPPFSAFRTAALNMRSTPDTNRPPLIITAATKQENKYGREEKGGTRAEWEGLCVGLAVRLSGWTRPETTKTELLAEVGWGQTVLPSRTETFWNTQICVWLVPDGTGWAKQ